MPGNINCKKDWHPTRFKTRERIKKAEDKEKQRRERLKWCELEEKKQVLDSDLDPEKPRRMSWMNMEDEDGE
jgi:hypothetical protein